MSSLSRFKERNQKRIVAKDELNKQFIFRGYPSTTLTGKDDVTVQAAVVNQQEKDKAYVYTQLEDKLNVGSVWNVKDLHILISEAITVIANVQWNKYVGLLCNLNVEDSWGFFKGPEKSYINVSLEEKTEIDSQQKPVLVLPDNILGFEDKIVIKGRAWLVQEYDAISNSGLIYYSLTPSTVSKQTLIDNAGKDVFIEHKKDTEIAIIEEPIANLTNDDIYISANQLITVSTTGGYFKTSNDNIKVKKHTADEVDFVIPFGISEVVVSVKDGNEIIRKEYKVR